VGARSFWRIVPSALKNFAVVVDLLHLHGHFQNRRPVNSLELRKMEIGLVEIFDLDVR
jgi:hypothetical protein